MATSPVKSALEELLRAHRLQADAPPLRGERRAAPLPTGLAAIDDLIGGGFPRGQLSEIHGRASSGRTAVAQAAVARAVRHGALAAWIDPGDRFDPGSAAEGGIDLSRLLWLRGRREPPNRPVTAARAVSAAGTVLGSGLFELVVLDIAAVPPAELARLPHTTWLRLQRTVENIPAALILVAQAHVAHGPGGVSLAMSGLDGLWAGSGPGRLLTGLSVDAACGRRRVPLELQASV
jgi:recA bacterial DNA recombination protein